MTKALVIDDELDICMMVTKHLQRAQFETDYALTVKEACDKIHMTPYELVLVDLNLPDGTGYDVLKFLKEKNTNAKIIVISAYDHEVSEVMNRGANMFIAKPFTMNAVNSALRSLNFLPE